MSALFVSPDPSPSPPPAIMNHSAKRKKSSFEAEAPAPEPAKRKKTGRKPSPESEDDDVVLLKRKKTGKKSKAEKEAPAPIEDVTPVMKTSADTDTALEADGVVPAPSQTAKTVNTAFKKIFDHRTGGNGVRVNIDDAPAIRLRRTFWLMESKW